MTDLVLDTAQLGFQWPTLDPFLFCVHHLDAYPRGNKALGPDPALLRGRMIGQDFEGKDGWRMYHGDTVPGFPQHPHRGFETVTIVRRGFVDHSDSLGAAARFGNGDTQWLTAGAGIVHSEMFPLLREDEPNPLELFQIWLNLPSSNKFASPHFTMFFREATPRVTIMDDAGRKTTLTIIAGQHEESRAPAPPPDSWAARADADVAIWTLDLEPHAKCTLPPASNPESHRILYFFRGEGLRVGDHLARDPQAVVVASNQPIPLEAGETQCEILMLQGRPIGEPVAQHGPFVMNSRAELQRAFLDYEATRFGGWPWPSDGPVHGREPARFARHADGRVERKER
jgi:redox-sensitive bicupin YhaK (pirin superfamily)